MFSFVDVGNAAGRGSGQDEALGDFVVLLDKAVDGGPEVDDVAEAVSAKALASQRGKEALCRVQQRRRGRSEVEGLAQVHFQPSADLQEIVGGVVVQDHVQSYAGDWVTGWSGVVL